MAHNSLRSMHKMKFKEESSLSSRRKSRGLERKQNRDTEVNKRRLISEDMSPVIEDKLFQDEKPAKNVHQKAASRLERLKQWREEKKRNINKDKSDREKPTFKVSHLQYRGEANLYKKQVPDMKPNTKNGKPSTASTNKRAESPKKTVKMPETIKPTKTKAVVKCPVETVNPAPARTVLTRQETRVTRLQASDMNVVKPTVTRFQASQLDVIKANATKTSARAVTKADVKTKGRVADLSSKMTASAAAKAKTNLEKPREFLRAKTKMLKKAGPSQEKSGAKNKDTTDKQKKKLQEVVEADDVIPESNGVDCASSSESDSKDLHLSDSGVTSPKHSTPLRTRRSRAGSARISSLRKQCSTSRRSQRLRKSARVNRSKRSGADDPELVHSEKLMLEDEDLSRKEEEVHKTDVTDTPHITDFAEDDEKINEFVNNSKNDERKNDSERCPKSVSELKETLSTSKKLRRQDSVDSPSEPTNKLDLSNKENMVGQNFSVDSDVVLAEKQKRKSVSRKILYLTGEVKQERKSEHVDAATADLICGSKTPATKRRGLKSIGHVSLSGDEKLTSTHDIQTFSPTNLVPETSKAGAVLCRNIEHLDAYETQLPIVEYNTLASDQTDIMSLPKSKRKSVSIKYGTSKSTQPIRTSIDVESSTPIPQQSINSSSTKSKRNSVHTINYDTPDSQQPVTPSPAKSKRKSVRFIKYDEPSSQQPVTLSPTKLKRKSAHIINCDTSSSQQPVVSSPTKSKRKSVRIINSIELDSQQPVTLSPSKSKRRSLRFITSDMPDSQTSIRSSPARSKRRSVRLATQALVTFSDAVSKDDAAETTQYPRTPLPRQRRGSWARSLMQQDQSPCVVSASDDGSLIVSENNVAETEDEAVLKHNHQPDVAGQQQSSMSRTEVIDVSDEGTALSTGLSPGVVYHVGRPTAFESSSRVLQELAVKKYDGEVSFIEIPLDDSFDNKTNTEPSSVLKPSAVPVHGDELVPEDSVRHSSDKNSQPTQAEEDDVRSSSEENSQSTQPFTPRRSTDVSSAISTPVSTAAATTTPGQRKRHSTYSTPFKTPGHPASVLQTRSQRKRRKTEHSTPLKSPEEMIEILKNSPMIEMTRRKSRHMASPALMLSSNFDALLAESSSSQDSSSSATTSENNTEKSISDASSDVEAGAPNLLESYAAENKVKYFRSLILSETTRLNQACEKWNEVSRDTACLDEETLGQIRCAVGKAQLLIDQRFKQFSGLIDNCEFGLGEKETTTSDLQGFWDMIYFQVEDIEKLFVSLAELQQNNWQSKQQTETKVLSRQKKVGRVAKPKVKSNFAAFREEMMRRKMQTAATVRSSVEAPDDEHSEMTEVTDAVKSHSDEKPAESMPLKSVASDPAEPERNRPDDFTLVVNTTSSEAQNQGNKENSGIFSGRFSAVTPKQLRYVPVVPSPLLNDITGLTPNKS